MSPTDSKRDSASVPDLRFTTTHWSVVLMAGQADSPQANEALEKLCRTYWYPLYVFVRRQGNSPEDAQDLTQAFFSRLLEKNYLAKADRDRGKFRTFLLGSLKNFLLNEWKRAGRQKRGGGVEFLSIDANAAEKALLFEELKGFIWGDKSTASYAEIGGHLNLTEGTVKVAVHRLRQRFRELLRVEVAHTVARPEDIDGELRHLISVVS